ncbi:Glycine receptor subunit alpha-2 [Amphibalanus amphitrite]|uniref:Glycine receptor subunit alpha-2 n=1 Tax=Amphibalanus amphitrite TaxID=1232801 RepID=A0A6A4VYX5_AMPAM|nr:Glycine receptor subunit alpha-2 [Amphibalanus amphitrite]
MAPTFSAFLVLMTLRCVSPLGVSSQHDLDTELQHVFTDLTDPSVYDKNVRPFPAGDGPVSVYTRAFVYYIGDIDAQNSNRMWIPTIYLVNQKDAKIIDVSNRNVFVNVCPQGDVYYSFRVKSSLVCGMHLRKFPFDNQTCSVLLESWQHSTSEMVMTWEEKLPFSTDDISLAEYSLTDIRVTNATFHFPQTTIFSDLQWRVGRAEAYYSRLVLDFFMSREPGYYLLDYYIPSGFLVIVSWVSFWLSPEAAPARVTLGTSTMLTFITLSNTIKNSLPKVSYTKFVDVWLFICTTFIFLSLVEFAFVNTIHRRRKNVTLKKVTTKHVLKSTLAKSASRDNLTGIRHGGAVNYGLSQSCSMLDKLGHSSTSQSGALLVPPSPSSPSRPTVFFVEEPPEADAGVGQDSNGLRKRDVLQLSDGSAESSEQPDPAAAQPEGRRRSSMRRPSVFPRPFVEMTPPQIAKWIDIRSRWLFPLCFLAVNIVYWISIVI